MRRRIVSLISCQIHRQYYPHAVVDGQFSCQYGNATLDKVELVPPGAPVDLVAKFGSPDPNAPGKILGLEPKIFVETWRQFSLNVQDDSKSYRVPFNEGDLALSFPGKVGPT
jgi:hypothetical protein